MRTAVGEQITMIETKGFEGPGPDISPAAPIMTSQELIEEIMLDAVRATGLVDVRFSTEATKLADAGSGATRVALAIRSRATGAEEILTGPALVAADGAASLIRSELGLRLEGRQDLSHIVNCYFRADIERHLGDRTAGHLSRDRQPVAAELDQRRPDPSGGDEGRRERTESPSHRGRVASLRQPPRHRVRCRLHVLCRRA